MKEPNKEQIQWFWEQCGWKQLDWANDGWHYEQGKKVMNWMPPDATEWYHRTPRLPRVDLNNLFKYAVPKLYGTCGGRYLEEIHLYPESLYPNEMKWLCELDMCSRDNDRYTPECCKVEIGRGEGDPALALFWAIYKAFGGKE